MSKTYRGDLLALEGLSLEVPRGHLVALLGPNGSGKSTLLRLCAGALRPSSGTVHVLGFDPARASSSERARLGFSDQDVALDPEMTGRETLELMTVLHRLDKGLAARELAWVADVFGLAPVLARRVSTYSGGMRRRLHVALSLLPEAELLLLDEPFVGLDAETRALLWASLAERARRGVTVLISTHELFDAGENCQSVAVIRRGRLLAFSSPRALSERYGKPAGARPDLEMAYLRLLREAD